MRNVKLLLIFGLIFISVQTNGQADTIVEGNKFNYIKHFRNDTIKKLGNYKIIEGQRFKHGYWIEYNKEGSLVKEGYYIKNRKSGHWTEKGWFGEYKNGKKDGNWSNGVNLIRFYERGRWKGTAHIHFRP